MEKKVFVIKKWSMNERTPETLSVLRRGDYDDEYDAKETFRHFANSYLLAGCRIEHITHLWNYSFVSPEGVHFDLYMFED